MATFKEQSAIRNSFEEIRRTNNQYVSVAREADALLARLTSLSPPQRATFDSVLTALGIDSADFVNLVTSIKTINDSVKVALVEITGTF